MTYHHINFSDGSGEWESGGIHSQHLPFPDDEKEWKNFFSLIDWLDFKFYRIGFSSAMIELINDDADPRNCNDSGFV